MTDLNKPQTNRKELDLSRPRVMGILNITPDSFSDGGRFLDNGKVLLGRVVEAADQMIAEGAHILDIGGESTRPGAQQITEETELERIIPLVEAIRQRSDVFLSIDTSSPEVMAESISAGADMINDVRALGRHGALAALAKLQVPVCLMHMQGEPRTMQENPTYGDVVEDVMDFLRLRVDACLEAGVRRDKIIVDPGFGFGKTVNHNLVLLKHLDRLLSLNLPILVGLSRKSTIGAILDCEVDERVHGSVAAAMIAISKGAKIVRVHDVKATVDMIKVLEAVENPGDLS